MKKEERHLPPLADYIDEGIILYEEKKGKYHIKDFNKKVETLEKITRKEAIGKNVETLFPNIKKFGLFKLLQQAQKTGTPQHLQSTLYKDKRIQGYRENKIYKTKEKELLVIYNETTEEQEQKKLIQGLQQLSEESPMLIIMTDNKGTITYVNKVFTETTGYTKEEAIGKKPNIIKSEETNKEVYKELWDTINNNKAWKGTFHNKKKDGSIYYASATIIPIANKEGTITDIIGLQEDITEKRILEENYKEALENSQEMIQTIGTKGNITYTNRKWREKMGYTEQEIKKLTYKDITEEKYLPLLQKGEEKENIELILKGKKGKKVYTQGSIGLLRTKKGKKETIGMFRDITTKKREEKEKEQFNNLAVNRELRMIELKKEINSLLQELGREKKYQEQ